MGCPERPGRGLYQALTEARDVLTGNFNQDNPQSKIMLERLAELSKQPVTVVTPDLAKTLSTVQALSLIHI